MPSFPKKLYLPFLEQGAVAGNHPIEVHRAHHAFRGKMSRRSTIPTLVLKLSRTKITTHNQPTRTPRCSVWLSPCDLASLTGFEGEFIWAQKGGFCRAMLPLSSHHQKEAHLTPLRFTLELAQSLSFPVQPICSPSPVDNVEEGGTPEPCY